MTGSSITRLAANVVGAIGYVALLVIATVFVALGHLLSGVMALFARPRRRD